jgi:hypothetical protein
MQTFWQHGWGAPSIDALVQGMGSNRCSLHRPFGGKRQPFVSALERNRDTGVADLASELGQAVSGRVAIQQFLTRLAEFLATAPG